jgi:hypothetical protein
VFTRSLIVFASTIMYYSGFKIWFLVLQVAAFGILSNGIMSVLNLYENVMNECKNINGIMKFFILKFAVGLMVVQGFFVEFIVATKKSQIHHVLKATVSYSSEERAVRIFCFVTLAEYVLLSMVMFYAFGSEMQLGSHSHRGKDAKMLSDPDSGTGGAVSIRTPLPNAYTVHFYDFSVSILRLNDVFRELEEKLQLENENEFDLN